MLYSSMSFWGENLFYCLPIWYRLVVIHKKKNFEFAKFFLSKTAKMWIFFDGPKRCRPSPAPHFWWFPWNFWVKISNIFKIWMTLFGLSQEIEFSIFQPIPQYFKNAIFQLKPKRVIQFFDMLEIFTQQFQGNHQKRGAGEGRHLFGTLKEIHIFAVFDTKNFPISKKFFPGNYC